MGRRKGDRDMILEIVIEHIFKYITKNVCRKILQNGDIAAILPRHANLKRFAARTITGANLKLEKRKKIYVIYMSVASEPLRGFWKY